MFTDATALVRLHEIEHGLVDRIRPDDERGRAEIERCRAEIDPPLLAKYERLKVRYGMGALAAAEDGICPGCRISLPSSVAGRLKSGVTFCDHCGRILYDADRVFNLQY